MQKEAVLDPTDASSLLPGMQVVCLHLQRLVMTPFGTIHKLRVGFLPLHLLPQWSR